MLAFDPMHLDAELPAVDKSLLAEGVPYELYDGVLVRVPPADETHATRHSKIAALLEAHVGAAFRVACDMLTRTAEKTNVAPDVSVYPRARDPETGGRQLEHLAFEVVVTESLSHAARKAGKLTARGVRRVFAIDVEQTRALEWSTELDDWTTLDPQALIEDPALAAPLPTSALLDEAKADDVVAQALLTKRNAVIEAALAHDRAEGEAKGRAEGKAEALVALLHARGVFLDSSQRIRLLAERNLERLDDWIARATTCTSLDELLAEP